MSNTAVMNPELTAAGSAAVPSEKAMLNDTVGRTLKTAREEKNLSLDEASRATKIKKEFLVAIEDDRFEVLPGDVFARGFVRSYADFLGLDGKGIATRASDRLKDPRLPAPAGSPPKRAKGGVLRLAILGVVGIAAAAMWYLQYHG